MFGVVHTTGIAIENSQRVGLLLCRMCCANLINTTIHPTNVLSLNLNKLLRDNIISQ